MVTNVGELIHQWANGMTLNDARALSRLCSRINDAIEAARAGPPTIDHHAITMVISKLEEAEFWAFTAARAAIVRGRELSACEHGYTGGRHCPRCSSAPGAGSPPL